ncbi:alpha/beta hydrolase [Agromyces sp. LHK192]|uniref:alpha/beta hydrolase n=1 Tax=Agromyces sp. LHK192 TaxID=2498704 RepID=UPI000FD83DBE|nr:alpha/beta hydrolase [Agromyces sp. LHK192]
MSSVDGAARARVFLERAAIDPAALGVAGFRDALSSSPALIGPVPPVELVDDLDVAGVRVRRYDPAPGEVGRAVMVYLHGGAFVRGTLDTADPVCRRLAVGAGCVVISVDYRLAPEHQHPAALSDAESVLRWVAGQAAALGISPERVCIGGDSAGATLATTVARRCPDLVAMQVLLCGLYDLSAPVVSSASAEELLDLEREQRTLDWVVSLYLAERAGARDADVSPARADDHRGVPEAVVVTSDLDPFAQQSRDYVDALRRDRVPVTSIDLAGLPHAFTNFGGVFVEAITVVDTVAGIVRRLGSEHRIGRRPDDLGATSGVRPDLRRTAPEGPLRRVG